MSSATDGSPLSTIDYGRGTRYGVGAFVVAFGVCGVLSVVEDFLLSGRVGPVFGADALWPVRWSAFSFWASHVGAFGRPFGIQLGSGSGIVPGVVYLAVPVLALAAAGYRAADGHARNQATAALQGAATAVGYGVATAASAVLLRGVTGPRIGIVQLTAVAGIAYPVIFGGLGGYLAGQGATADSRSDSTGQWSTDDGAGQTTDSGGWSTDDGTGQTTDSGGWSTGEESTVGQPDPDYGRRTSYCPSCGHEVDGGANYCPNCGTDV